MKKILVSLFTATLLAACGDDNSSSATDDISSSSEETTLSSSVEETSVESSSDNEINSSSSEKKNEQKSSSSRQKASSSSNNTTSSSLEAKEKSSSSKEFISDDNWITTVKINHFSFFDEKNMRYYLLDDECDYDSSTGKFIWVTENYTGVFDKYDSALLQSEYNGDSLKYMIDHSYGFKISNDTLYECDYYGNACDTIENAYVYVGTSKSIFSTWEFVGRIYEGVYTPKQPYFKITLILEPNQRTVRTSYRNLNEIYEPYEYCYLIYKLFEDESKEETCFNYFKKNQQPSSDTLLIDNDLRIVQKNPTAANILIGNKNFEVNITYTIDTQPTTYIVQTKNISYQGTTCTSWYKNLDITQEYCEATEHDMDFLKKDYSNIHHAFVNQLLSYSDNDDEFEECIKQFNLK